jgi:hypothetical protein
MAKATFQRNQKVWVESVGAWSVIEKVMPMWAQDFNEPIRVTYDVGFGRPFQAHELRGEEATEEGGGAVGAWRLLRARNKWQSVEDTAHHPYPGTFPVVVTDFSDWGGWRVPGAEYDRDPRLIEFQARLIASAPTLREVGLALLELVNEAPQDAPPVIVELAARVLKIENYLREVPAGPPGAKAGGAREERAA